MDGLECSEIWLSNIDLGDRYDAEYFTKKYLNVQQALWQHDTVKLDCLVSAVASAFYPAATQLYDIGDIPFIRCVDCINHPIITQEQDNQFKKIPYVFGKNNSGITFLKRNDIVITKVGSPCYASIINDYQEVALSRTVLGLTNICGINPYYLMIFLRCKYGFEQLFRQRELTIQYQLTLNRVKDISVYMPSQRFQSQIENLCVSYINILNTAKLVYAQAEQSLLDELGMIDFALSEEKISVKSFSDSFGTSGRLDAEYYQTKYDTLFAKLSAVETYPLDDLVWVKKSVEPGSNEYLPEGIPFVRVSDLSKYGLSEPEIHLSRIPFAHMNLQPKKDTILLSKDGSVGIAYKVEKDLDIVTSGAILHLELKTNQFLPDYLTLVLNSLIVKMQAERDAGGSIIQHWKPSEIEKVVIPCLPIEKQELISHKIQESFSLRRESKELLEIAKQAVEIAIENNEQTAIAWLSTLK